LIAPHLRPVPVDVADDFAATALGHWHAPDLGPLPSILILRNMALKEMATYTEN
jgi:hypothetical protein